MIAPRKKPAKTRAAVYSRLSVDRPDQELGSIEVQRERCAAYVASQEGWELLPEQYDDDGFSGGSTDRPALQRLIADIEACNVDRVVTHRIDRLSRSMIDFLRLMEVFEQHGASLVSVTQQFDTSTAWGRMVLNILVGFAQFEREMISERTRDKVAAARSRGKWTGGRPVLGYDVAPEGGRLMVNEDEAEKVRNIFGLYLAEESLAETARECGRRDWRQKEWTNRRGTSSGGRPFTKAGLSSLLSNPLYIGRVRSNGSTVPGEHDAIVDPDLFQQVQRQLKTNAQKRANRRCVRNTQAWLSGLLRCSNCDAPMVHSTTRKGSRMYRYYVCRSAQSRGWTTCPSPSVPAGDIEAAVFEELRGIGSDPDLLQATAAEVRKLAGHVDVADLATTLEEWQPLWSNLTYSEQGQVATSVLEQVTYDGDAVEIQFREGVNGRG